MNDGTSISFTERYFLAAGFSMLSVLLVVAGVDHLDVALGIFHIYRDACQLSSLVICRISALCAAIAVSKGLLAGSILMLMTVLSCITYVLSYFLGFPPSEFQDPFLSLPIFLVGFFFYRRRDHYLAVATEILGLSLLLPALLSGHDVDLVLGVGLLVSGALFGLYGSTVITEGETGRVPLSIGSVFRHASIRGIAMNPYETGVPLCSVLAGLLMVFVSIFYLLDRAMLPGDQLTICTLDLIVLVFAFYLCLRNIIAEGLFHLLFGLDLMARLVTYLIGFNLIPLELSALMVLPTLFVTGLCIRRHDPVLAAVTLINLVGGILVGFLDFIPGSYGSIMFLHGFSYLVAGGLLLYHGISRWLLIAVRREVLPLFSGNVVRSDASIHIRQGYVRPSRNWNISSVAVDMSHVVLAALLLWSALFNLNSYFEFIHIDLHSFIATMLILGSLVAFFTVISIGRGAVTESIVFLLIGVSCFDFALDMLYWGQILNVANGIYALILVICSLFYIRRRSLVLGTATMLFAFGSLIPSVMTSEVNLLLSGALIGIAGSLYALDSVRRFLLMNLGWHVEVVQDRSKGLLGLSTDTYETIVTLGYIMLALLLLLLFALPYGSESVMYIAIHSTTLVFIGLYAIDRKYLPEGFSLLIPGLIFLMDSVCRLYFGVGVPSVFVVILSLSMLSFIAVFALNGERMTAVFCIIMMVSMMAYGLVTSHYAYWSMFVAALLMIYGSIQNWLVVELRRHILPVFR
ncbi:MAG: hypothetical protein MJZ38_04020 [archaeon]|nr:hypothetical protein [archaeon]